MSLEGLLRLRVGPGFEVRPSLAGGVSLEGLAGFDEIGLDLGLDRLVSARLLLRPTGVAEVVIPLLPDAPGLGALADLANAAVKALLPLALDALARTDNPVGSAVGELGDALGLRTDAPPRSTPANCAGSAAMPASCPRGCGHNRRRRSRRRAACWLRCFRWGARRRRHAPRHRRALPARRTGRGCESRNRRPAHCPSASLRQRGRIEPLAGLVLGGRACVTSSGVEAVVVDAEVTSEALLGIGSVPVLPFARVLVSGAEPPGPDHRLELGLWTAPPATPDDRRGIVAKLPFAADPSVVCRSADGATDSNDLSMGVALAVRSLLLPLAAELVLSAPAVIARLEKPIDGGGSRIGEILDGADIVVRTPTAGGASYDLASDALDPEQLGRRVFAIGARVVEALGDGFGAGDALAPVTVELAKAGHADRSVYGVRLGLAQPLELFSGGGVRLRLEADASWTGEIPRRRPAWSCCSCRCRAARSSLPRRSSARGSA